MTWKTTKLRICKLGLFIFCFSGPWLFVVQQSAAKNEAAELNPNPDENLNLERTAEPFAAYSEVFKSRNIFKPNKTVPSTSVVISDEPVNYQVVGVILDQTPSAVLLDLQTQKTLMVTPGDQVPGGTVREIKIDGVVLSAGKETITIPLQK